jgi:hypothetical protein
MSAHVYEQATAAVDHHVVVWTTARVLHQRAIIKCADARV